MWLMSEIIQRAGAAGAVPSIRTALGPEPRREEPGTGLRRETGGGGCWVTGRTGLQGEERGPEGRKAD